MIPKIIVALLLVSLNCLRCSPSEENYFSENDRNYLVSIINESFVDILNPGQISIFETLVSDVQKGVQVDTRNTVNPKLQEAVDDVINNSLDLDNIEITNLDHSLEEIGRRANNETDELHSELHTDVPKKDGVNNTNKGEGQPEVKGNTSKAYEPANDTTDNFWVPSWRRLFHGEKTLIADYPFMATVLVFNKFQCAGSVVKSDLVLTAASGIQLLHNNRFYRETPRVLAVRVGSTFYGGGGEVVPVGEIYFHPDYVPNTLRGNLALLRLSRHLVFTRHRRRVKKIRLDRRPNPLSLVTESVVAVGWGAKTSSNRIYNPWVNRLSTALLRVYPLGLCRGVYSGNYVTEHNFCAGFVSRGGGACNRDVGGPGVVAGRLSGVISFGPASCGAVDAPTVFTRVGDYIHWIDQVMDMDVPSLRLHVTDKSSPPSPTAAELQPPVLSPARTPPPVLSPARTPPPPGPEPEPPTPDPPSPAAQREPEVSSIGPEQATAAALLAALDALTDLEDDSEPEPTPGPALTARDKIDFAPIDKIEEIYDKSIAEEEEPLGFGDDDSVFSRIDELMQHQKRKDPERPPADLDSERAEGTEQPLPSAHLYTPTPKTATNKQLPAINVVIQANLVRVKKDPKRYKKIGTVGQPLPSNAPYTPISTTDSHTRGDDDLEPRDNDVTEPPDIGPLGPMSLTTGLENMAGPLRVITEDTTAVEDGLTTPEVQEFSLTDVKAEIDADEVVKYFYDLLNDKVEARMNG